jgi:hypothetical protein
MGCSFVPPPHSMALAMAAVPNQDYVLAIQIDPQWVGKQGIAINSAALDVDRYSHSGLFVGRMTYAIPPDFLSTSGVLQRLLIRGVGKGGDSLAHCTATLNFQVTVKGNSYSVQSPVYVDP